MDLEEIKAYRGHPAVLDRLAIATPRGQLVAMFGLGAELYVEPRGDQVQLRQDMLSTLQDYYQRFRARLTHYRYDSLKELDGKIARLPSTDPFPELRGILEPWPKDHSYSGVVYQDFVHPDFPKDRYTVTPWVGKFLVASAREHELSAFSCYLPVTADGKAQLHYDKLREALLHWCALLQPAHGGAGYCVVLEVGAVSGEPYVYSTLQRHPGLNLLQTVQFSSAVKQAFNRIKGVNWLTVLGDAVLDELGGLTAARRALEPDCLFHTYDGGVVIQAGELPLLGDSYTQSIPEVYRKVARFTRPVRFDDYRRSLFRAFKPLDNKEETLKWVRRFD